MVVGALQSMAMWMFLFQEEGSRQDTHHGVLWLAVIGIALTLQALAVVGAALVAMKLLKKIDAISEAFEKKTDPIISKANALIDDIGPKVRTISTNVENISYTARVKVDELSKTIDELNRTVKDVNERSKVQISRVDGIVSDALTTTYEVSRTVQENIKGPVRQIAGVMAGLKAGLETLVARSPFAGRVKQNPYDL